LRGRFRSWAFGPSPISAKLLVKAILGAGTAIGLIVWGLFSLASFAWSLLGFPSSFGSQLALRVLGGVIVAGGVGLVLWIFRYRSPFVMIVSTYFTFLKMFTGSPVSQLKGRTEPLIVKGPQKYVRNPLYLGAIALFLGWALVTGSTSLLVGVLFVLVWFRFVQIPFEEKELRAIFGEEFDRYSAKVPMLIPLSNRWRGRTPRVEKSSSATS